MAKSTTWKTYDAEIEYAQVFPHNMDKGNDNNDAGRTAAATEGQFKLTMVVDQETKDQMVADGIPEKSLGYDMFKPVEGRDGFWRHTVKRPNLSPFKDEDGNPQYFGPPNVVDYNATVETGTAVKWDDQQLIGNGSKGKVKVSIYKNGNKRIIRLESLGITEHVPYGDSEGAVRW
jgi:hypothetical protein